MSDTAVAALDLTGFDLRALPAGFHDDPYRWYAALRSQSPVRWMPDGSLLLTRWADCEAVYRDAKLFSSDKRQVIGNLLRIPTAERGPLRWTSAANPIGTWRSALAYTNVWV